MLKDKMNKYTNHAFQTDFSAPCNWGNICEIFGLDIFYNNNNLPIRPICAEQT